MPVENVYSIVISMEITDSVYRLYNVFTHERFHLFQFDNFEFKQKQYQDHLNQENVLLIHLETMLLEKFLKIDEQDKNSRINALKDFISIHKKRSQLITEDSQEWEDNQQKLEGIADYVAFKSEEYHGRMKKLDIITTLLTKLENTRTSTEQCDFAIKRRHYPVGTTLAFALDYIEVEDWKSKIKKNSETLFNLLEIALPIDSEDLTLRVENIIRQYDVESISQFIGNNLSKYAAEIDDLMAVYFSDPGIDISLGKPNDLLILGFGFAKHSFYLQSGNLLQDNITGTYNSKEGEWRFSSKNLAILRRIEQIFYFKIEKGAVFEIDSNKITIDDIVKQTQPIYFVNLRWEGETTSFESNNIAGRIIVMDGRLSIEFFSHIY
jgi:hypothetical protein